MMYNPTFILPAELSWLSGSGHVNHGTAAYFFFLPVISLEQKMADRVLFDRLRARTLSFNPSEVMAPVFCALGRGLIYCDKR